MNDDWPTDEDWSDDEDWIDPVCLRWVDGMLDNGPDELIGFLEQHTQTVSPRAVFVAMWVPCLTKELDEEARIWAYEVAARVLETNEELELAQILREEPTAAVVARFPSREEIRIEGARLLMQALFVLELEGEGSDVGEWEDDDDDDFVEEYLIN